MWYYLLILSNGSFLVDNTYIGSPSYTNAVDCMPKRAGDSLEIVKIFDHLKQFKKFCIAEKQWPSGIMEWKIFWTREELKLKTMQLKVFNFWCKILQVANFNHNNFNTFWSWKCIFSFWFIKYFGRYKRNFESM